MDHQELPGRGHSRHWGHRRPQRGSGWRAAGHRYGHGLHSRWGGAGGDVGSRVGGTAGRGAGRGGSGQGVSGAAGPHDQPAPQPAGRAQLRVLQRGSDSDRAGGRCVCAGGAVARGGHHAQALRGQRLRVRAQHHRLPGGRAHPAGAVSGAVRARGARRRHLGADECLQPAQRHLLLRERVAADPGVAGGVGLRRVRDLRLVRGPVHRGVGPSGAEPGDARTGPVVQPGSDRRGPGRGRDGRGPSRPDCR